MYMRMLFQTRTGRESFAAFGARVTPSSHVMCSDMALQIRWVREDLPNVQLLAILWRCS